MKRNWWLDQNVDVPTLSPMYGLTHMTTGHFQTAAGEGFQGSTSGFWVGSLFRLSDFPASIQTFFCYCFSGTSGGMLLYQIAPALLTFLIVQPENTYAITPTYTMSTTELGKVMSIVGVYDSSGPEISLYVNGSAVGSPEPVSGYLPNAANVSKLGSYTPDDKAYVYGAAYGVDVPNASAIAQWHSECKASRQIVSMPGGYTTDGLWRIDANSAISGVPDLEGTADMSINGTPTVRKTLSRFAA
jgi:hypothetical protein